MTPERMAGAAFDREFTLAELLRGTDMARLAEGLAALAGPVVRLLDAAGRVLAERGTGTGLARVPLILDLEPVGFLEGTGEVPRLRAAGELVRMVLRANARYLMASELHMETVHADYDELQRRHAALQASESRYRELAAQLEQRVAEQVQIIEQAQRQLYQSEKLAAVGQLAAGVAHEINNPIGFIKSNLNTAQDYVAQLRAFAGRIRSLADPAELQAAWRQADLDFVLEDFAELLQESDHGAARVARIVADLKGFSRIDQVNEEEADLNEIIAQVCNVAAPQVQGRAELVQELGALPRLHCNAAQLGQVLLGMLLNAVQAMDAPGEVRFITDTVAEGIRIRIRDTGRGIPPEHLARLFEPFFTTRDVGQGTGLGLTVARDIVQAHGGSISVDSTLGQGTTFTILLPLGGRRGDAP